jgi:hypothetical protein
MAFESTMLTRGELGIDLTTPLTATDSSPG